MKVRRLTGSLHVGSGCRWGRITWFPVWATRPASSAGGLVPREGTSLAFRECPEPVVERLLAINEADVPALLVQGTTLRGGNQDRTCTTSLLVPPWSVIAIPVVCIEQGRWAAADGPQLVRESGATPRVRTRNVAAGRRSGVALDQPGTWAEIDRLHRETVSHSSTGSYHDLDGSRRLPSRVRPLDGQRGVVIGYGGRVRSFDLFDSRQDLVSTWAGLLEAAQTEATGAGNVEVPAARARQLVTAVSRLDARLSPSPGWGEDLRAEGDGVLVSGIARGTSVLHLAAFRDDLEIAA
jgi:hypothetical protein